MKIKKSYILTLCIFISVFSFFIFLLCKIGYLPIVGNIIAEKKLTQYSSTVNSTTNKVETRYDWYNIKYQSINDDKSNFSYKLQNNSIYDETINTKSNLLAQKEYTAIKGHFSENLNFPSNITVWTELSGDDYSIKSQRLYLLGIYNLENISKEDSLKMPSTIAKEFINLMGEDYNFTSIQLIYYDKNGGYTIEISSDNFKKLEYEDMLKKTRKMQEKELGEEYFNWLSKSL